MSESNKTPISGGFLLADREKEMMAELFCVSSIDEYAESQKKRIKEPCLHSHLNGLLEEKNLLRADIIKRSNIDGVYMYQIFDGKKNPSRDKLILICFAFRLGVYEAQELLFMGKKRHLSPRILRDAIILFGLSRELTISDVEELLMKYNQKLLLAQFNK